jgi:hypothetical protein
MRTGISIVVSLLMLPSMLPAGEPSGEAGCGCLCLRPPITFSNPPPPEVPAWCAPRNRSPVKLFNRDQQPPTWCPPVPVPPVKLCCVQHPSVALHSRIPAAVTFCIVESKPPLWKPGAPRPPIQLLQVLDTPPQTCPNVTIPSVKLFHYYQPPYPECPPCVSGGCGKPE